MWVLLMNRWKGLYEQGKRDMDRVKLNMEHKSV